MLVAMNDFARRQTADSPFSHFEGSEEELLALVTEHFEDQEPGYKPGIILVNVAPIGFRCGIVELDQETELVSTFAPRREGEDPFVQTRAKGTKAQAVKVQICLYSHEVLVEGNENSTDAEWEIVSINAQTTLAPEPQHPVSMARNFLGMEGGTAAEYTAEDFAKAIIFWSTRAMVEGS